MIVWCRVRHRHTYYIVLYRAAGRLKSGRGAFCALFGHTDPKGRNDHARRFPARGGGVHPRGRGRPPAQCGGGLRAHRPGAPGACRAARAAGAVRDRLHVRRPVFVRAAARCGRRSTAEHLRAHAKLRPRRRARRAAARRGQALQLRGRAAPRAHPRRRAEDVAAELRRVRGKALLCLRGGVPWAGQRARRRGGRAVRHGAGVRLRADAGVSPRRGAVRGRVGTDTAVGAAVPRRGDRDRQLLGLARGGRQARPPPHARPARAASAAMFTPTPGRTSRARAPSFPRTTSSRKTGTSSPSTRRSRPSPACS